MEEITMAINTDLPESKERIEEAYAFLSENGINEQNYTALKKKTENESDLRHGSMIEFMLHVGMHAEKMREIDELKARLRELEGEPIIHLICPRCGHEVQPEDVYCRDCGEKL